MSRKSLRCTGIEHEPRHACTLRPRSVAFVELMTTAALALSIGIARADVVGGAAKGQSTSFAIALVMGLLLSAVGALSAAMAVRAPSD
jgi:hypothetical protein